MKETMLILHFIGLAMGLGTSFAFMFLGMAAAKMDTDEGHKFTLKALAISKMGHIGLTLLVVSGIYLILPFKDVLMQMPYLLVKLILVLVLGACIGILSSLGKKAQAGNTAENLKKMEGFGKISMLCALAIVVMAVLSFH